MSLPTSQLAPFIYSGAVTALTTNQMVAAITGMMSTIGWTTTGAGTWRCLADSDGRQFEVEVSVNTGVALSNQIQFAAYKTTKAADNNVLTNRGFSITTGSSYKIYVTPYSVYSEVNSSSQNAGNEGYAMQLYAYPLTISQTPNAIIAGGHKNYGGSAATNTSFTSHGNAFNGVSGALAAARSMKDAMESQPSLSEFKGGRIMMFEEWISFDTSGPNPIFGRPYNMLLCGGNAVGGFEIPSGTGTVTYTILNAFTLGNRWSYYIRTA